MICGAQMTSPRECVAQADSGADRGTVVVFPLVLSWMMLLACGLGLQATGIQERRIFTCGPSSRPACIVANIHTHGRLSETLPIHLLLHIQCTGGVAAPQQNCRRWQDMLPTPAAQDRPALTSTVAGCAAAVAVQARWCDCLATSAPGPHGSSRCHVWCGDTAHMPLGVDLMSASCSCNGMYCAMMARTSCGRQH